MAVSRRPRPAGLALAAAIIAIVAAGCGAAAGRDTPAATATVPASASVPASTTVPVGWSSMRLPSGAILPYPPGFRPIAGDPGSASAAVFDAGGTIRAYLNATPATPDETLAGWTSFRLRHIAGDGDHDIRMLASRTDVARGAGRESCVVDRYTTSRTSYRELACIVLPGHGARGYVLVAAAQPAAWAREHASLALALHKFVI